MAVRNQPYEGLGAAFMKSRNDHCPPERSQGWGVTGTWLKASDQALPAASLLLLHLCSCCTAKALLVLPLHCWDF